MEDIQIQDPYTDRPKYYQYQPGDCQLLVDLLHEYSDKLVRVSREIELKNQDISFKAKAIEFFTLSIGSLLFITSFLLILITYGLLGVLVASKYQTLLSGNIRISDLINILIVFVASVISSLAVIQINELNIKPTPKNIERCIHLLNREARVFADKLEKVMQVTIEIQDKIEMNLARKLELDLRVEDARSAIDYYHSIEKYRPSE
jgi:hypothetical protein